MDEFLAVAKSLDIKELCNAETESNNEPDYFPSTNDQDTSTEMAEEQTVIPDDMKREAPQQKQGSVVTGKYESDRQGLLHHKRSVNHGVKYACNKCDYKATQQGNLTVHIQSKHDGVKYACNQCDYQASRQDSLKLHIQAKHDGVRYACSQCDYQATTQGNLTIHIQAKHEGIKYACNQCDYQAKWKVDLTKHIKSKHEHCL